MKVLCEKAWTPSECSGVGVESELKIRFIIRRKNGTLRLL